MPDLNIPDIRRFEMLMEKAARCVVTTHTKPDGDAIGSCVAMYRFLKGMGKEEVKIVLSDRYPANLGFIISDETAADIIIHEKTPSEAEHAISGSDLIICLDFNAFHRTDRLEKSLASSSAHKVLVDHHLNPDRESFGLMFSETEVSSASELLYHILMLTGKTGGEVRNLPAGSALAIMTGVTTDTNNFANSTYPSTLRMTADLLEAGTDRDRIISELYNTQRENRIRLMGHALQDLLKITEYGVAYMVLDESTLKRYDVQEGDTEGFVNMPLAVGSVRMSLLLKEEEGKVRVSIRSKKGTSANRCAGLYFNGGGHENAAGGKLYMPKDIRDISEAAAYIEKHTQIFLNKEDEK